MKKMKKSIAICLLVFPIFYACKEEKKEHNTLETTDVISIKTATVESLALTSDISASGLVTTENEANYAFKIGGVVSHIFVEEGQFFIRIEFIKELVVSLNHLKVNTILLVQRILQPVFLQRLVWHWALVLRVKSAWQWQ